MSTSDEIDALARRVGRGDAHALPRLVRAIEAATGRRVEAELPDAKAADRLVGAGMRIQSWHDRLQDDPERITRIFWPDTVRGVYVDRDGKGIRVNWSELAMHSRCAGAEIVAWGASVRADGRGSLTVLAAWIDREKGTAGCVEGVGTEVLPPGLERITLSLMGVER